MNKFFKINQAGLANRLWFFAGLALFLLLFIGLTKEIVNRRQILRQINEYEGSISRLQAENAALHDKISNWDKSGELELNARVKLGLERPGEQTIIINRSAPASGEAMAIKSNQEVVSLTLEADSGDRSSNPAKWWKYFFR